MLIIRDRLIIFKIEALINGRTSLSSFVGMGSKRHVDGLEEVIIEVNSERSVGEKESNLTSMY